MARPFKWHHYSAILRISAMTLLRGALLCIGGSWMPWIEINRPNRSWHASAWLFCSTRLRQIHSVFRFRNASWQQRSLGEHIAVRRRRGEAGTDYLARCRVLSYNKKILHVYVTQGTLHNGRTTLRLDQLSTLSKDPAAIPCHNDSECFRSR